MLTLLALAELLYLHIQRLVQWLRTPHRLHYRSKRIAPAGKLYRPRKNAPSA